MTHKSWSLEVGLALLHLEMSALREILGLLLYCVGV